MVSANIAYSMSLTGLEISYTVYVVFLSDYTVLSKKSIFVKKMAEKGHSMEAQKG
jgi:hypothetical protein